MASPLAGNLGSVNAAILYQVDAPAAYGAVGINILTGLTGTLVFEATIDSINWFPVFAYPMLGGQATSSLVNPATGQYCVAIFGYAAVRVRVSAYTSGVTTVTIDAASSDLGAFGLNALMPGGGGMVDALVYAGVATAPGANGDILAAQTPGVAGTYLVQATCAVSFAGVAIDASNIQFMKNAALFLKLACPAPGGAQFSWRMTLTATDTIGTKAIGAATATVVYGTTIVLTRIA